ncbi:GNAT family N-acetyltransferase [Halobacteriales archaeon QS_3_64_16]|nr:MAG: GNAT family N-acetyltransferase [Halobacteriales archaeon QS_3_64_16]
MASKGMGKGKSDGEEKTEPESEYEIRPFEPGDRGEICSLYETVFEETATIEWFDWKYTDDPFIEGVPIVLAERENRIVGARPFFALEMCAGDRRALALQPGDTMVHPEHRRKGLFTRMTEAAIERYGDREPEFFFNFPNDRSRPGYLDMGWRLVSETPIYYRIQNPARVLGLRTDSRAGKLADRLSRSVAAAGLDAIEDFSTVPTADVTIERRSSVPAEELAGLYESDVPERIHARRSERFYHWRFSNPRGSYTTYLARQDGDLLGSAVVGSHQDGGTTIHKLLDVLPMGERVRENQDVLASLLGAIVADSASADAIAAHSGVLDHDVLAGLGFLPDDSFPLARCSSPTTLVVRSVGTEEWTLGERELTEVEDWQLAFAERDTA